VQGLGVNKRILDPYIYKNHDNLSIHAEAAALKRCARTQGATIYVARVNNRNEPMLSRPCAACMDLLKVAGVKKVVYTINNVENI
jgi:deoxycytidylate deaminase